jgi:orotate phosphoribosyltransferase
MERTASEEPAGSGLGGGGAAAELRRIVLEKGYERREVPFRLSSGGLSHDYVDLRRAFAAGSDLSVAARAVVEALAAAAVEYDLIGGMTMGADPVAHLVAVLEDKAWFSVRKAAKEHGTGRRVEGGRLAEGVRAVVFEDTASTGRSLIEALSVVEATGAFIAAVCIILDRGEALSRALSESHPSVPFVRVLSYRDIGIEPL